MVLSFALFSLGSFLSIQTRFTATEVGMPDPSPSSATPVPTLIDLKSVSMTSSRVSRPFFADISTAVASSTVPVVSLCVVLPSFAGPSTAVAPFSAIRGEVPSSYTSLALVRRSLTFIFPVSVAHSHSREAAVSVESFTAGTVDVSVVDASGLARQKVIIKHQPDFAHQELAGSTADLCKVRDENDYLRSSSTVLHDSF